MTRLNPRENTGKGPLLAPVYEAIKWLLNAVKKVCRPTALLHSVTSYKHQALVPLPTAKDDSRIMGADFDNAGKEVVRPSYLAHVVLRTNNLKPMVDFYKIFLNAHASFENDFISFLTYDHEHHRIAILQVPGTAPKQPQSCGLEHIAFTYDKLDDLALSYRQRKANGIMPVWSINHGATTSIYYQDPDGNQLETQVDNFSTNEGIAQWLVSKEFAENPIGTDFDPEDLVKRLQAGEDHESIKKRIEIGPRFAR